MFHFIPFLFLTSKGELENLVERFRVELATLKQQIAIQEEEIGRKRLIISEEDVCNSRRPSFLIFIGPKHGIKQQDHSSHVKDHRHS